MRASRLVGLISVCLATAAGCSGANFEVAEAVDGALDDGGGLDAASEATPDSELPDADATLEDSADASSPDTADTSDAADASDAPDTADVSDALDALDARDAPDAPDAPDVGPDAATECPIGATRGCYTGADPTRPGHGICHGGLSTCVSGVWGPCENEQTPQAETCNGLDDDCNDTTDDAPGANQLCAGGLTVGACTARTLCVKDAAGSWNPTPQCVGTFVSPSGTAGGKGSPASPLKSITAAISNAQLLGGGADVCVCANGSTVATFSEKVKMVEGTSVFGSYDCASWTRPATLPAVPPTTIQDIDAEGVNFPAGITAATALDGMTVRGFATNVAASAISVVDSSPSLNGLTVTGGASPTSVGLAVVSSTAAKASPTVTGGAYAGQATASGTQMAIYLQASPAKLVGVTAQNAPGTTGTAATSIGLRCAGCGAATISRSTFGAGAAVTTAKGLWLSGDATGFTVDVGASTASTFSGGTVTGPTLTGLVPYAASVHLDQCSGNPKFENARLPGGGATPTVAGTARLHGLDASGASCSATFTAGWMRGCESGGNCFGAAVDAAPVTFANVTNGGYAGISGAVGSATMQSIALHCTGGGCRSITGSTISGGTVGLGAAALFSAGLVLDHSSPIFDANLVTSPGCSPGGALPLGPLYGARLYMTSARLTNSVFRDAACPAQIEVVQVTKSVVGPLSLSPDLVGNTIEYGNCLLGSSCGARMGVSFGQTGSFGGSAGHFDDNIVRSLLGDSGGSLKTYALYQYGSSGDWTTFSANDLFDLNAWSSGLPVLFYYQGASPLGDIDEVNKTLGAAVNVKNIAADPKLDPTWHLLSGSPCIDHADPTFAPTTDRDGQTRPAGGSGAYDIGADEFY